jgi:hypothetical protein
MCQFEISGAKQSANEKVKLLIQCQTFHTEAGDVNPRKFAKLFALASPLLGIPLKGPKSNEIVSLFFYWMISLAFPSPMFN